MWIHCAIKLMNDIKLILFLQTFVDESLTWITVSYITKGDFADAYLVLIRSYQRYLILELV